VTNPYSVSHHTASVTSEFTEVNSEITPAQRQACLLSRGASVRNARLVVELSFPLSFPLPFPSLLHLSLSLPFLAILGVVELSFPLPLPSLLSPPIALSPLLPLFSPSSGWSSFSAFPFRVFLFLVLQTPASIKVCCVHCSVCCSLAEGTTNSLIHYVHPGHIHLPPLPSTNPFLHLTTKLPSSFPHVRYCLRPFEPPSHAL
jgi:hypothetical protein